MQRVPVTLRLRSSVTVETSDVTEVFPGKQQEQQGLDTLRYFHKQGLKQGAEDRLAESAFFTLAHHLKGGVIPLIEKHPMKVEHKRCAACRGSGKGTCAACNGAGTVTCQSCNGQGATSSPGLTTTETRAVPCPACSKGFETKFTAESAYVRTCPTCHGTGTIGNETKTNRIRGSSGKCGTCGTSGKVRCTKCNRGSVGTCGTCEGQKSVTEVYSVAQVARVIEEVDLPKPFRRFGSKMLASFRTRTEFAEVTRVERKGKRFVAHTDIVMELGPVRLRQKDGTVGDYEDWVIKDFVSGEVWRAEPNLLEKLLKLFGFGPKPPFGKVKTI